MYVHMCYYVPKQKPAYVVHTFKSSLYCCIDLFGIPYRVCKYLTKLNTSFHCWSITKDLYVLDKSGGVNCVGPASRVGTYYKMYAYVN